MSAVLVLTVALLLAIIVSGYKYGAPEQMCRQPGALQRAHGGSTADIASMEYSIGVKKGVGGHFEFSIMAYGSNFFRGYLMEVVNSGRNQNTVGHFDQHNSDARKVCGSLARPTVISHNSGANKQNISVTWVAPKFMENHTQYLLRVTIVKTRRFYWQDYEVPFTGYRVAHHTPIQINGELLQFDCGQGRYAAVPESGCKKYTVMDHGRPVQFQCGPHTLFDYKTCDCNHQRNVNCPV